MQVAPWDIFDYLVEIPNVG